GKECGNSPPEHGKREDSPSFAFDRERKKKSNTSSTKNWRTTDKNGEVPWTIPPLHSTTTPHSLIARSISRLRLNSTRSLSSGSVLMTSDFSSHPLRAMPAPRRRKPACSLRWASQLITHFTPRLFA